MDRKSQEVANERTNLVDLRPLDPLLLPAPSLPAPPSNDAICKLSVIRTGLMTTLPAPMFHMGSEPGSTVPGPSYAFLIETNVNGCTSRVLYDLGFRNTAEHENSIYQMLGKIWNITFTSGVPAILEENHIPLDSISALILGHAHFDHIGNLAKFPTTMSLVVGPGSPLGADLAREMDVPLHVLEDRRVRCLSHEIDAWKDIGGLRGYDYFGNGSLWLLDTPGHKEGHITALVRTAASPSAYHLLACDTAHAISHFNIPNKPSTLIGVFPRKFIDPSAPENELTCMHSDLEETYASIGKIARLDMENNINVCLAHDYSMESALPPGDIVHSEGTLVELTVLKNRDRSRIHINPTTQ